MPAWQTIEVDGMVRVRPFGGMPTTALGIAFEPFNDTLHECAAVHMRKSSFTHEQKRMHSKQSRFVTRAMTARSVSLLTTLTATCCHTFSPGQAALCRCLFHQYSTQTYTNTCEQCTLDTTRALLMEARMGHFLVRYSLEPGMFVANW
jgi:hypothetical protein